MDNRQQIIASCNRFLNHTLPMIDSGAIPAIEAEDMLRERHDWSQSFMKWSAATHDGELQTLLTRVMLECLTRLTNLL